MFSKTIDARDLWIGEMRGLTVAGRNVLLINVAGEIRAYENRCAHLGVPLSEGTLDGTVLTCQAHHWQYDALTGLGVNPSSARLSRFSVKVESGAIWIEIPPGAGRRNDGE